MLRKVPEFTAKEEELLGDVLTDGAPATLRRGVLLIVNLYVHWTNMYRVCFDEVRIELQTSSNIFPLHKVDL